MYEKEGANSYNEAPPSQFVRDLADDVATLRRIVYEGNGEPSLVSRVIALEKPVTAMVWMTGAILVCFLGIVGTVIGTIILEHLLK
jgi:hypothetical protein